MIFLTDNVISTEKIIGVMHTIMHSYNSMIFMDYGMRNRLDVFRTKAVLPLYQALRHFYSYSKGTDNFKLLVDSRQWTVDSGQWW